mmetsp:Transcript_82352/g.233311  ORF Transcript_82352/g.233311 Transcript_82352/m.233311 type:complete len:275 (+) Transcript_82352:79-903(+)
MPAAVPISQKEHDKLLKSAMRVEHKAVDLPPPQGRHTHKRVTKVEVPHEETVRVPITTAEAKHGTEKRVIKGTKLVPVQKFKEVEETSVQIKEEVVKGYRTVWKQVREPYEEIIKKPVTVTKIKKVPYTDYETKQVEVVVDVPCDRVNVKKGFRMDKKMSTKMVEVEQDEHYEMRPVLVGKGEPRMRHNGTAHLGQTLGSLPKGYFRDGHDDESPGRHSMSRTRSAPGSVRSLGTPMSESGRRVLDSRRSRRSEDGHLLMDSFGDGHGQTTFGL